MLRSSNDFAHYHIAATDGEIGKVRDIYFDDDHWVVRYLVVSTGSWLAERDVLISPYSVRIPNWGTHTLAVTINKEEVRNSPPIDTHKPVSRQHEIPYLDYYGYPYYWAGSGMWGQGMYPYALQPSYPVGAGNAAQHEAELRTYQQAQRESHRNDDPHLRSCKEVVGYHLRASDGEIGHVESFLIDEDNWAVRYLVVHTNHWWTRHKVLIAPQWISGVHWESNTVSVNLTRSLIQTAPHYESLAQVDRTWEAQLYQHYDRAGYWHTSHASQDAF